MSGADGALERFKAAPRSGPPPVGWPRRLAGGGLAAVVLLAAGLFAMGAWNPWDLVILRYWFGNPPLGLLLVSAGGLLALWLAVPVRQEARQGGRIAAMLTLGGLVLAGVAGTGLFGTHFRFDTTVLARTGDGARAVVMVTDRDTPPESYLRIWDGAGLAAREVGELGRVCWAEPRTEARFLTRDRVELATPFGTWQFDLDPATGVPRQVLGPRCPDGPVPATLETTPAPRPAGAILARAPTAGTGPTGSPR